MFVTFSFFVVIVTLCIFNSQVLTYQIIHVCLFLCSILWILGLVCFFYQFESFSLICHFFVQLSLNISSFAPLLSLFTCMWILHNHDPLSDRLNTKISFYNDASHVYFYLNSSENVFAKTKFPKT